MLISIKHTKEIILFCYIALTYLWLDDFYAIHRFNAIGINSQGNFTISEYSRQAVFIFEYFLAIITIHLTSRLKGFLGITALLFGWFFFTIDLIVHSVYERPADLANIAVLNASIANTTDAMQKYANNIFIQTGKSSLLFIPLIIANLFWKNSFPYKLLFTSLTALTLIYGTIMIKRGAPALIGFPKGFSYCLGSVALKINDATFKQRKIPTIKNTTIGTPLQDINNIIVIIDESIEFNEFNNQLNTKNETIFNLGQAYSGGNCSASSNYILRKGYWDRASSDGASIGSLDIKEVDSLFLIAKRNGFSTTYIDNQGVLKDPTVRNYFNEDELLSIDKVIENSQHQYQRDLISIKQIIETITTKKNFILVQKNGAHFPYENTLEPSQATHINLENYKKSVKHNSVDFINRLASEMPANTVVFYSSDHGQELSARTTHCNAGDAISIKEYTVPFLIITNDDKLKTFLHNRSLNLKGNLTHIEFSESVRNALGERIENANSVFQQKETPQNYCGLFGQPLSFFGTLPSCKPIIP